MGKPKLQLWAVWREQKKLWSGGFFADGENYRLEINRFQQLT